MEELGTAALAVETRELDVVCGRGRSGGAIAIRNAGDGPLEMRATTGDPWLKVRGGGIVEAGETARVEVDVDASAVPTERVLHRRKGDRFTIGRIAIESNGRRAEVSVRSWEVGRVDARALAFGAFAGFIPFINAVMAAVLACDTVARRRSGGSTYRRFSELRENACFLAGLAPGLIVHAWLFVSAL